VRFPGTMDILGLPREVVYLVLGWLFGLLTLPIGDAIRRRRERPELAAAIMAEMTELRHTMALVAYTMKSATGEREDAFLAWLEDTVAAYNGPDPDLPKFLGALRELKARRTAGAGPTPTLPASNGLSLKSYELPFLNSQVHKLGICSTAFQRQVLQIKAQLDLFNAEAGFLMRQFELTFDASLDTTTVARVQANLQSGYGKLGRSAVSLADQIATLEKVGRR
jgi:hypothetical protein